MPGGWRWGAKGIDGPTGRMGKYGPQVEWHGRLWSVDNSGYYRHAKGELLHRAVWEAANGPIPADKEIHHRDGNKQHYALEHLELVSHAQNMQYEPIHGIAVWDVETRRAEREQFWTKRQPHDVVCEECGTTYQTTAMRPKYCSKRC